MSVLSHVAAHWKKEAIFVHTVRPRDTRPQAARTLTMHVFELGPKKFEMHVFDEFLL